MRRMGNRTGRLAFVAIAVMVATAAGVSGGQQRSDAVLDGVPAEALFCLRLNNPNAALSSVNGFLEGVAPAGFDSQAMVWAKLEGLVGAERMAQVAKQEDMAIFGVVLPAGDGPPNPFANLFLGLLLAVEDYDAFVGPDKPDSADEVAVLNVDGQARAAVARMGRYALTCSAGDRDKLVRATQMLRDQETALRGALSNGEKALSAQSPIWLYGNIQGAGALIKPMVHGKLEQIKAELQKAAERDESPIGDPEGVIRFYASMIDTFTSQMASVAVGLAPSAEACTMTLAFKAVPGTDMAMMMTPASQPSNYKQALPYLSDGAILNVAAAVDPEIWEKSYQYWIGLIPQLMGGDVSESDLEQLRTLTTESFRAMGEAVSFSFQPGQEGDGPFSMQYVIDVTDGAAIEKAIAQELELTNSEVFGKIFDNFGFRMNAEMASETTTYKGVTINAARMNFEMDDDESPQGEMIRRIWGGDGLPYRWAVVEGKCVYTVGPNAETDAHKLIDQVKAGVSTGVSSEMRAALAAIPSGGQIEAVGTLNYVRLLNAFVGAMPLPDGKQLPELNVPTESNLCFAAGTMADVPVAWVVLPKQHLMEIKSAFETLSKNAK